MLKLYVMRHAKSSWDHPNLDDHERPLSKRGEKNAKKICEFFVKKNYKFDYILLSSSKRTKKTLKILLKKIDKPKKIISSKKLYLSSEDKIIDIIKKIPKKYKSVLLINHEPTVRNLIRSLTKNHNNNHFKLLNYKFPTSAFAKIYFDFNEWNKLDGNGLIKEFMRPKDLQDSKE
tara:strand:- start:195 stop:719 length:525 start_codon:yes stop_codon:yes gene_type:complete